MSYFPDVRHWLRVDRRLNSKGGCLAGILIAWGAFFHFTSSAKLQLLDSGYRAKFEYCTREEIRHGQWNEVTLSKAPYIPPELYYKGVHRSSVCEDFSSTDFNTYEWVPHNSSSNRYGGCVFDPWNATEFCSLGWTSIAILGDSLSWEHYSALLMSLGLHSDPSDQFVSRRGRKSIFTMGCNDTLKLIYQRTDQLEYVPQVIREDMPQILILNKGSHPVDNDVYEAGWNQTISILEDYERNLTRSGIPNLFLFRTTVPGHPQCETYAAPVNDIAQIEAVIANKSSYQTDMMKFKWWQFKDQNKIMEGLLEASTLQNYHVMDAYDLNIRRPDRHRPPDCLHNCFPGKTEVYHQLMLHFLKAGSHLSPPTIN